jgi:hypothetical protein
MPASAPDRVTGRPQVFQGLHETVRAALRDLPPDVFAITSMLSYEERALLFGLARDFFTGQGLVVDAGTFVGGSTLALSAGLMTGQGAAPGTIHSYDRLKLDEYAKAKYFAEVDQLAVGCSLRPVFEQNLASHRQLVVLHEGDVMHEAWDGSPIEILFIDVAKSWEINGHVVREFFPSLIAGQSVLIQQDLVHWAYPWCAIVMEVLADRFTYDGWIWYASSVWRCARPISRDDVEIDWREKIGLDNGLRLLRRAARRAGGAGAALLELARAKLMLEFGQGSQAMSEVGRIEEMYGSQVPYIQDAYAALRAEAQALR